jgi:hypothetical protein
MQGRPQVTAIVIEVPDSFTGFQLKLRLRDASVVRRGQGVAVRLQVADRELQVALSQIRKGLASFDLESAKVEVDGQRYMLEVN